MQLFAISKKKKKDKGYLLVQYRKKSHIILLEVRRRVMKENDDEMIFIKGRFCHIKHIFTKESVDLYLFVYMNYLWVTLLRAHTFILVEKRLCSYKAFIKPEMIGDLELLSGYPETLKVTECLTILYIFKEIMMWRG